MKDWLNFDIFQLINKIILIYLKINSVFYLSVNQNYLNKIYFFYIFVIDIKVHLVLLYIFSIL